VLPVALEEFGHFVTLVLPKYRSVDPFLRDAGSAITVTSA
jgi:hypothetical protein